MKFTLAGKSFELTSDDVRGRLADHHPDSIDQYWVEIDGTRWPVKQVMSIATGLARTEFQSQNSRRLLSKLGFTIGKGNAKFSPEPKSAAFNPVGKRRTAPAVLGAVDVVLVGCVKSKRSQGAPAKDLYTSDYFFKMRAYAEQSGKPCFILSAEHGLVDPEVWLEPYDCYLPEMSREYRREWGQKVAKQLEAAIGSIDGVVIDIHAGAAYVDSVRTAVEPQGARVVAQLEGLSIGHRKSWYLQHDGAAGGSSTVIGLLREWESARSLSDIMASGGAGLRAPGMYSWWIDEVGAEDLSKGLGHEVQVGLVYAGLAGATRSGGSTSSNTLWGRIATMHLGKRNEFSTLRRSLGSILAEAKNQRVIDEVQLTAWMHAHLRVIPIPVADADTLDALETVILTELDPPLNLAKVPKTPLRARLSELRKKYGRKGSEAGEVG
jgi:hypothetical protein